MTTTFSPRVIARTQMAGRVGRTPSTPADEREKSFITLAPYRDGTVTLGKFSGTSAWERHPNGDEIVSVVEGMILLRVEQETVRLYTGEMIIIPRGAWHQIYAPDMAAILYVTPHPTEHFEGDILGRQLDPLGGPGERILAALLWLWFWLRGK